MKHMFKEGALELNWAVVISVDLLVLLFSMWLVHWNAYLGSLGPSEWHGDSD